MSSNPIHAWLAGIALLAPLAIASGDAPEPPGPQLSGAALSGGDAGGTIADVGVICTLIGGPGECQLPDRLGHGAEAVVGATSDKTAGFSGIAVSERIANDSGAPYSLTQVCWWGFYVDFAAGVDCWDDPGLAGETFDITIYTNNTGFLDGCPVSVPGHVWAQFLGVSFAKQATGNVVPSASGDLAEFEYTATLPAPVILNVDTCYWIEILNDTSGTASGDCLWLWQTAPPGDNVSAQDRNGDGFYVQAEVSDFDMAICLDVPLGDTSSCDAAIDPLCPGDGRCSEPHPTPGCDDPCCCSAVCEVGPMCCTTEWTQDCVQIAIDIECTAVGGPVCMATGADSLVDGYLEVCADAYGGWSSPTYGGLGDRFNPDGGLTDQEVAYTSGLFIFRAASSQRELLSTDQSWQAIFGSDASLERHVTSAGLEFDTDGDGVTDALESSFTVAGLDVDLAFELSQSVSRVGEGTGRVSGGVTQTYVITNNGVTAVDFELLRVFDGDLVWSGDFGDDSVGTFRAEQADAVFMREENVWVASIAVSSPNADAYFGAKKGIDPDGGGPGPVMGYGTSTEAWDAYGIPEGWENYIAGVDANTDGESGAAPDGCVSPCDAHIGLRIPVSLEPGAEATVRIDHGYGGLAWNRIGLADPQQWGSDGAPIIHALGDVYGDGTIDVAAVIPGPTPSIAGKVQLFHNLGGPPSEWAGLDPDETTIPVGLDPNGIVLGLFNSDPLPDMAVTNAGDDEVWIFLNDGTTFPFPLSPDQEIFTGDRPSAITSGHFNADPHLDLAVTNEGDSTVVILVGDVNGEFTVLPSPVGPGRGIGVDDGPVALLSDDFDNNDDDDLGGASKGSTTRAGQQATAWALLGDGAGGFVESDSETIGDDPMDVSSGDVSRDNFADIVSANKGAETLSVLVNQGDGTFEALTPVPSVGAEPLSIEAVDLDNDVDADLAVVATVAGRRLVLAFENLALPGLDISFAAPLEVWVGPGANANFVVAGDLNADGVADLVTVNADSDTGGSVTVLLGSIGAGVPGPPPPCRCDCEDPPDGSVDVGDFLALLSQWGLPGTCDCEDPPDGSVDVGDFLALLAEWGPCP
ncbi:MAG: FG-GAP-like repeat-containing protein [Planctomycetota bacterium]|jgi:hypothetical protein